MSKCKKIDKIDGVVAKVKVSESGDKYGEFVLMNDGESLARIRMTRDQVYQFKELLTKVIKAVGNTPEEQEYKIVR